MTDAFESGDAGCIAHGLGVVARVTPIFFDFSYAAGDVVMQDLPPISVPDFLPAGRVKFRSA